MANQFLVKETMADMKALSAVEITALQNGTYEGVQLLGYYEKGDTPAPIIYHYVDLLNEPDPGPDDGGSVIVANNIKLVHKFANEVDVKYFGVRENIDNTALFTTVINTITNKGLVVKISGTNYLINANYNNSQGLLLPKGKTTRLNIEESVWFNILPTNVGQYTGITCVEGSLIANNIRIRGERDRHIMPSGNVYKQRLNQTDYAVGDYVTIQLSEFIVIQAGTSGDVEPTFESQIGQVVNDGSVKLRLEYKSIGEWGFGLALKECYDVHIDYLEANNCWGDGLYIGKKGEAQGTNKNITIHNAVFKDNRRQGMSVISIDGLTIETFTAINTMGTNPQAGIDFEPNHSHDILKNIYIKKAYTNNNNGYGILFALVKLSTSKEDEAVREHVDITIDNWKSVGERGFSISGDHQNHIPGRIILSNFLSVDSPQNAGVFWNYVNMPDFILYNPYILNCNKNKLATVAGAGLRIVYRDQYQEKGTTIPPFTLQSTDIVSKIEIVNFGMHQDTGNPAYNAISVQGQGANLTAINNVRIVNPKVTGAISQFRYPYYSNLLFEDAYDDAALAVTVADINHIQGRMIKTYHNFGATASTFVVLNPHTIVTKNTVKIEHRQLGKTFGVKFLNNNGYVSGISSYNGMRLETGQVGAYLVLRQLDAVSNVWQVVDASGAWRIVEGGVIKNVTFNSVPAQASTNGVGGVLQAATSANDATNPGVAYVQSEAQSVLLELRDLKTKLRTAGVLAP